MLFPFSQICSFSLPTSEAWETFLPQWNLIRNSNQTDSKTDKCVGTETLWTVGLKEEPKGNVKNSLRQTNGEPSKSLGDAADTALRKLPAVNAYGSMQEGTPSNTRLKACERKTEPQSRRRKEIPEFKRNRDKWKRENINKTKSFFERTEGKKRKF